MKRVASLLVGLIIIFTVAMMTLQAQESVMIGVSSSDDIGTFLVDANGSTLYVSSEDDALSSACIDDCLESWSPVTVSSVDADIISDGIAGTFGVLTRDDGSLQVTYNRQPLYTFQLEDAGTTDGNGFGDVWSVARPQVMDLGGTEELGSFLVDGAGNTLYLFTSDSDGISNCTGDCLTAWPAFTVSNSDDLVAGFGVAAQDDLSLLEREDTGELQVVYQGLPLYYFVDDSTAGDTTGQGIGDVWFVVTPQAFSATDDGVLVGRDGTTLYITPEETSASDDWLPLLATSDADLETIDNSLRGSTSLTLREDGSLQIAFNTQALFYYVGDALASEMNGDGIGDLWSVATVDMEGMIDMTETCTVTPSGNVNLRGGPSTLYGLQGALLTTDAPLVIGQATGTDGFIWYQLESTAWVRSDLVTASGNCDSVPSVAAPPLPPTAVPVAPTAVPAQPEQPQQPAAPPPAPPPATTEEP